MNSRCFRGVEFRFFFVAGLWREGRPARDLTTRPLSVTKPQSDTTCGDACCGDGAPEPPPPSCLFHIPGIPRIPGRIRAGVCERTGRFAIGGDRTVSWCARPWCGLVNAAA